MKIFIAFLALVCGFAFVLSNPLERTPEERLSEIKAGFEKIFAALNIEMPADFKLPPMVTGARENSREIFH